MDHSQKSPSILSLCTGMRGLERGIERAIGHIAVAAYVEIEAFVIYNLVKQMEQGVVDAAPLWTDLKTFPSKQFYGKIHGIIGGYPCQPFSLAGNRKGEDDPRHLWPHIERIIAAVRPVWCFFENVDDHLTLGYNTVKESLRNLGYKTEEGVYSAEEVGSTQERQRLYILALANTYSYGDKKGYGFEFISSQERRSEIEIKEWERLWYQSSSSCENEFGNPNFGGFKEQQQCESTTQKLPTAELSGYELANSNYNGSDETENAESIIEGENGNTTGPPEFFKSAGCSNTGNNEELADTNSERGQLQVNRGFATEQFTQWPAPQGADQYEWEEPRTVEPGVGCTVNGYNFKNDLLRMYGNGVVEQTAELAFIDLLRKHNTQNKVA